MKSNTRLALPSSQTTSTALQLSIQTWTLRLAHLPCTTQAQSGFFPDSEWQGQPRLQVSQMVKPSSPSLARASIPQITRYSKLITRATQWCTHAKRESAFPSFGSWAERLRWTQLSSKRCRPKPERCSLTTTGALPQLINRVESASMPLILQLPPLSEHIRQKKSNSLCLVFT